jgi:NADH-quinone oxidoreductase subunit C
MSGPTFVDQLKSKFGDTIVGTNFENIDPWIEVTADGLVEVCEYLCTEPGLSFDYLNCISGVDYFHADEKKQAKASWDPHVEIVYHLFSMKLKHSLVLKVCLPRWKDDTPGQLPEVPSVTGLWGTANWHEREVFDLCGIHFTNHPDLHRILCPEDWVGHPLRRDYEMPLEYHGIRGR